MILDDHPSKCIASESWATAPHIIAEPAASIEAVEGGLETDAQWFCGQCALNPHVPWMGHNLSRWRLEIRSSIHFLSKMASVVQHAVSCGCISHRESERDVCIYIYIYMCRYYNRLHIRYFLRGPQPQVILNQNNLRNLRKLCEYNLPYIHAYIHTYITSHYIT